MKRFVSQTQPSREELLAFMGASGAYYLALEKRFTKCSPTITVQPHNTGRSGWNFKMYRKSRYLAQCNIVEGGFDFMCRLDEKASAELSGVAEQLCAGGRTAWEQRYPCGTGFWLHVWVTSEDDLRDALLVAEILLNQQCPKSKEHSE